MKIEKDRVVRFHYAVAEAGKEQLETSRNAGEPLAILFGRGQIIPGLEKAMDGREAGDSFKAAVTASAPLKPSITRAPGSGKSAAIFSQSSTFTSAEYTSPSARRSSSL